MASRRGIELHVFVEVELLVMRIEATVIVADFRTVLVCVLAEECSGAAANKRSNFVEDGRPQGRVEGRIVDLADKGRDPSAVNRSGSTACHDICTPFRDRSATSLSRSAYRGHPSVTRRNREQVRRRCYRDLCLYRPVAHCDRHRLPPRHPTPRGRILLSPLETYSSLVVKSSLC